MPGLNLATFTSAENCRKTKKFLNIGLFVSLFMEVTKRCQKTLPFKFLQQCFHFLGGRGTVGRNRINSQKQIKTKWNRRRWRRPLPL